MPHPQYAYTGPFVLERIDTDDDKYLKLTFSDGYIRKMAKGGKWPPYLAVQLHERAKGLQGEEVYVVTSQTTKEWDTRKWLCNIILSEERKQKEDIESKFGADVLWVPSETNYSYIEYTFIQDQFKVDADIVDFENKLSKEFAASWDSSKHARMVNAELDIRRIRIGKDKMSKRQGYRVTAFKAHEEEKGWSYFIVLQLDEKLKDEKKFPYRKEMVDRARELMDGDRSPEKIREFFASLSEKRIA